MHKRFQIIGRLSVFLLTVLVFGLLLVVTTGWGEVPREAAPALPVEGNLSADKRWLRKAQRVCTWNP